MRTSISPPATMAGAGRDRLVQSVGATADPNGAATFRVGPAPLGYVWEFTVQIPGAPTGTQFAASVLGSTRGTWVGPTNFGPIQLYPGESLVVTAVGLTPATVYGLVLQGISIPDHLAEPISPTAPISTVAVETATIIAKKINVSSIGAAFNFQVPPLLRRLTLVYDLTAVVLSAGATLTATITGADTGALYYNNALISKLNGNVFRDFAEVEPALDSSFNLSITGGASGQNVVASILAAFTNPLVAANEGIRVVAPIVQPLPVTEAASYPAAVLVTPAANTPTRLVAPVASGSSIIVGSLSIQNKSSQAAGCDLQTHIGEVVFWSTSVPAGGFASVSRVLYRVDADGIDVFSNQASCAFCLTYGIINIPQ